MPSELFGDHLNGYDVAWPEASEVVVRCASDGAIRAAAKLNARGELDHVAVEPSPYGAEAIKVLELAIALRSLPVNR